MTSKVYFSDLRTKPGKGLLEKLEILVKKAGIETIDFKDKFVAIKIHFGEPGNLSYIRANYAAKVVSIIKELGGKPFLTDANTLYSGSRSNAVEHLRSAEINGFASVVTGAQCIIADGLKGTEYREIEINLPHCKTAKIGSAIADADIIISLNHFKGHEMTGFGGALKNIGMGAASRGGKLELHSASKPVMRKKNCVSCGVCIKSCAHNAIAFDADKKAEIDYAKCVGCGQCVAVCMYDAAQVEWDQAADTCNEKIAEYAVAVVKGKPHFHVNFIINVSPNCDCWNINDAAIAPDLGIAASFDPIALDVACANMVNAAPSLSNNVLTDKKFEEGNDKFTCIHSNTDWKSGMRHGEKIGLGSMSYQIVQV